MVSFARPIVAVYHSYDGGDDDDDVPFQSNYCTDDPMMHPYQSTSCEYY